MTGNILPFECVFKTQCLKIFGKKSKIQSDGKY